MLNAVNFSFVGFAQSLDSLNGVMFFSLSSLLQLAKQWLASPLFSLSTVHAERSTLMNSTCCA